MVHKVTFTKTADKAFSEITLFLEENASRSVAVKFANKVYTSDKIIQNKKPPINHARNTISGEKSQINFAQIIDFHQSMLIK